MAHSFKLPKPYLSWSSFNTWCKSKKQFRQMYYEGIRPPQTPQTMFGHNFAKELEYDPTVPGSETNIQVTLRTRGNVTLTVLGYLDGFFEGPNHIDEYKTGHRLPDGKPRWDKVAVRKHRQLDMYSLLVKEKFGHVDPWVNLIWYETEWAPSTTEFEGHTLTAESNKLRLTGHKETFARRIAQWERAKMKKDLFKAAKEIEQDYEQYTRSHPEILE